MKTVLEKGNIIAKIRKGEDLEQIMIKWRFTK
jgi:hypothetical protein